MKIIWIIILLLKLTDVAAQSADSLLNEQLHFQIKQLDEFIQRFNHKIDVYGREISVNHSITRPEYLFSLFDTYYLQKESKDGRTEAKQFVSQITDNNRPQFLKFANENLFALAQCKVNYKGKEKPMQLLLKVELVANGAAKWVIYDVKADFLQPPSRTNNISIYIAPNSHETYFMGMRQGLQTNKDQVTDFAHKDFQPDALSIFLFEIANKNLKINFVNTVTYHFLQLEGWAFTVDFFNRADKNSGWLISKLTKLAVSKEDYIKAIIR